MKSRNILIATGTVLLIGTGLVLIPRSEEVPPSGDAPTIRATPRADATTPRGPVTPPLPDVDRIEPPAAIPDAERAVIFTQIEQASATYDAKALPLIEPYLLHSDPEVRLAAMNGLVVLGEAAAAPLLREAAGKAPDPKEAVSLNEAAAFLELPAGTFVPKDRTAPGIRKPLEGKPGERTRPKLTPPAKPEAVDR